MFVMIFFLLEYQIIIIVPNTGISVKADGCKVSLLKKMNEKKIKIRPTNEKIFAYLLLERCPRLISILAIMAPQNNSHTLVGKK